MTYPTEAALAALAELHASGWWLVPIINPMEHAEPTGWMLKTWAPTKAGWTESCESEDFGEYDGMTFAEAIKKAHAEICTPATPGEVAAEPTEGERYAMDDLSKCPQCGGPADNGHSREIPPAPYLCSTCEAKLRDELELDEPKGGAMPTNEEQYEAMVARGHQPCVHRANGAWYGGSHCGFPVDDAVVSACLLAGQLEAMRGRGRTHTNTDPAEVWSAYLFEYPVPAQTEPSDDVASLLRRAVNIGLEINGCITSSDEKLLKDIYYAAMSEIRRLWYDADYGVANEAGRAWGGVMTTRKPLPVAAVEALEGLVALRKKAQPEPSAAEELKKHADNMEDVLIALEDEFKRHWKDKGTHDLLDKVGEVLHGYRQFTKHAATAGGR